VKRAACSKHAPSRDYYTQTYSKDGIPSRLDLAKAKIERFDALGRKADFHGLRYTFATRLAKNGISQRFTQELMRHSDPALTANIYTDASQLPTYDAVASLPWEGKSPDAPNNLSSQASQIASQDLGPEGHSVAQTDTKNGEQKAQDTAAKKGKVTLWHLLSRKVKWSGR